MKRSSHFAAVLSIPLLLCLATAHAVVFSSPADRASFGFALVGGTNVTGAQTLTQSVNAHKPSLDLSIASAVLKSGQQQLPPVNASATGVADFGLNRAAAQSTASALFDQSLHKIAIAQGDSDANSRWIDYLALVGPDAPGPQDVRFLGHVTGSLTAQPGSNGGSASYTYDFKIENSNVGVSLDGTFTRTVGGQTTTSGDLDGSSFDVTTSITPNTPFFIVSTLRAKAIGDASASFFDSAILDHIVVPDGYTLESASKRLILLKDGTYAYAVPEPSAKLVLTLGGVALLAIFRWRRRPTA